MVLKPKEAWRRLKKDYQERSQERREEKAKERKIYKEAYNKTYEKIRTSHLKAKARRQARVEARGSRGIGGLGLQLPTSQDFDSALGFGNLGSPSRSGKKVKRKKGRRRYAPRTLFGI